MKKKPTPRARDKSDNYVYLSLKGYKNQNPRKNQMKFWTIDCIQDIPYPPSQMILGGLSDCWFAVFAHANSNKAPTLSWPKSGTINKLVLKSLNTSKPKKGLFHTLAVALAHNRDRKLTEFHRLKDLAISVDGLPWNKEILRTFLYLINQYQRIVWNYSNPCEALKSIDLVGFIDLTAKGMAKRVYTETLKQTLLHLLIIQDTRITATRVDSEGKELNAFFANLQSSQLLRIVSKVSSEESSKLLCDLLENPNDERLRSQIRSAGLKIDLLEGAIDKVQCSALKGIKHKFIGDKIPVYKAQIFTMPLPVDVNKMDEYRLFAFLSAYTNQKNKELEAKSFNFEALAAVIGKSSDLAKRQQSRIFRLAAKVCPMFCSVWGYDGSSFSFLMERSSDQSFDYKAICQNKRAQALAEFTAERALAVSAKKI